MENSSERRLLLCLAPRRVHFARPWTQASKPALTDSSLATKTRVEALYLGYFFQPSIRAHHDDLHIAAAALCVLTFDSRMIRSHERRSLGALLFSVDRFALASIES